MSEERAHLIIGGGVIGLCCGYFLSRAGHRVVVIDRDEAGHESCSDRNSGMVVPSHFTPLAAPGVVSQGLKWMLNPRSPFYLRPRLDAKLWAWCWQFLRHSNRRHVTNSRELLRDLSLESRALFEELSITLDFPMVKKGLLMLCQTEEGLGEESEVARMANEIGIKAELCGPKRLAELEPGIKMKAKGGVWYEQDCHLDSEQFLAALKKGIEHHGGIFRGGEVVNFRLAGQTVTHVTDSVGNEIEVSGVTLAGGAWSPCLASRLGLNLPVQGGKGYSFTLTKPHELPQLCYLLKEGRVAVTPTGRRLRVAGTMEICGDDLSVDQVRLSGIIDSFCQVFPAYAFDDFEGLKAWSGLRPCSPDGLPYVGAVERYRNVTVATGHAMLGLSLGPVTGRLIRDLVAGQAADVRLAPERF